MNHVHAVRVKSLKNVVEIKRVFMMEEQEIVPPFFLKGEKMKKIIIFFIILNYVSIILTSELDSFELNPNWTNADILKEFKDPNSKLSQYLNKDNKRKEFLKILNSQEPVRDRSCKNLQNSTMLRKHEKQD